MKGIAKLSVGKSTGPAAPPSTTAKEPRELSRREREAIEKERAKQHFLKMKEKEDAARLAIIRKKREEEAARFSAEQKGTMIFIQLCD